MAYVQKKSFMIKFKDDHEFAGLEVRMRRVSVGKLLKMLPKIEQLEDVISSSDTSSAMGIEDLFKELGAMLISWNIEREIEDEDGKGTGVMEPVPSNVDGLIDQELRLVNSLFQEWAVHLAGVAAPLSTPSSNGEQAARETQLPMDSVA